MGNLETYVSVCYCTVSVARLQGRKVKVFPFLLDLSHLACRHWRVASWSSGRCHQESTVSII